MPTTEHLSLESARIVAKHLRSCRFRIAATLAVPVECEHERDVCPECDPCTCKDLLGNAVPQETF